MYEIYLRWTGFRNGDAASELAARFVKAYGDMSLTLEDAELCVHINYNWGIHEMTESQIAWELASVAKTRLPNEIEITRVPA